MSYRMSQWLDTSPESLAQKSANIFYGVQERRDGRWGHLHDDGEPCLFDNIDECGMFIDLLRLADRESPPSEGDHK
jgi:hypothetical protein